MKSLCTNICETNKKAWLSEKCGITGSPESVLGMMAFGTRKQHFRESHRGIRRVV